VAFRPVARIVRSAVDGGGGASVTSGGRVGVGVGLLVGVIVGAIVGPAVGPGVAPTIVVPTLVVVVDEPCVVPVTVVEVPAAPVVVAEVVPATVVEAPVTGVLVDVVPATVPVVVLDVVVLVGMGRVCAVTVCRGVGAPWLGERPGDSAVSPCRFTIESEGSERRPTRRSHASRAAVSVRVAKKQNNENHC